MTIEQTAEGFVIRGRTEWDHEEGIQLVDGHDVARLIEIRLCDLQAVNGAECEVIFRVVGHAENREE